jgi:hypothetical protein
MQLYYRFYEDGAHSTKGKPPPFPDNVQFWYETVRAFGTARHGGSELGEAWPPRPALSPATSTAGMRPGMGPPRGLQMRRRNNSLAGIASVRATVSARRNL